MADYSKSIQPNRNTFIKTDGDFTRSQVLQDMGEYLQCLTVDTPFTGQTESSSEEEYNEVGDEILAYGRVGTRPSHAPS